MCLEGRQMEELLLSIGMDMEEIIDKRTFYSSIGIYKISAIINLLKRYNCSNEFIKECLLNSKIVTYQMDKLSYILDSIVSNGDMIEEILLEIV